MTFRGIGEIATEVVEQVENKRAKRLELSGKYAMKEAGRESASTLDPGPDRNAVVKGQAL